MTGPSLLCVGAAILAMSAALPIVSACSSDGGDGGESDEGSRVITPAPTTTPPEMPGPDLFDVPLDRASAEELSQFAQGDKLFELPLRDADGLGPLFTRASCGACHASGARGPGAVQKMVVVLSDGITPADDQSALPFGHTVHPLYTGVATKAVVPPVGLQVNVLVTTRVGPPIVGRGYMEAVLDSEIERVAAEQAQRADGIHGRINHVTYASEPNGDVRFHTHQKGDRLIGRFGLKGRIATIDDFTADALQSDMGITNPLRPVEFANPEGLVDDLKAGTDVTLESVNLRAMYVRLTAIPARREVPGGAALFAQAKCSACHVPSLRTKPTYPIAALANIDAPIYSDLLIHDMGIELADGIRDGEATSRDWRTPPLIGLRFYRTFLHDSRATSIEQAILLHGGSGSEATGSLTAFQAMSEAERATLVAFVGSL